MRKLTFDGVFLVAEPGVCGLSFSLHRLYRAMSPSTEERWGMKRSPCGLRVAFGVFKLGAQVWMQ